VCGQKSKVAECVTMRLSQNAIEFGSQWKRTWKSGLSEIWWKRKWRIASDSAFGTPMMRRVNPVMRQRRIVGKGTRRRTGVDVYRLPARSGMDADDGVSSLDGLAADGKSGTARTIGLRYGTVQSGQTFEVDLHAAAEGRVERLRMHVRAETSCARGETHVSRAPERVAAVLGASDHLQRGGRRRLDLVGYVRVPELELGEGGGVRLPGGIVVHDCRRE
jgi:hypothetical protein